MSKPALFKTLHKRLMSFFFYSKQVLHVGLKNSKISHFKYLPIYLNFRAKLYFVCFSLPC